ncbi:SDR family NAD(P)-dependent oxidoreductase [Larkinella punicea]|uniref:SDR family NAD(P)-dependent oxidoreductase n=1 Tax=Larkinella punicea TaxID=2315727 RepID=A0A368JLT6_9BACT|nr:SDR family oxidoreductase [Larkinella punicea]RCR68255.1 SDR family NAD(P)-dependent oxidoreductase [Larkinella punicea]
MNNFEGKNILIVGASSGIGQATAQRLQAAGATVFTAGRRQPEGIQSTHLTWDATQPGESDLSGLPDTLHGLVYAPGSIRLAPFGRLTLDHFQEDFTLNVLGAIAILKTVMPALLQSKSASVVLFSTVAAQLGFGLHSSVSVSKSAVEGLTKSLAAEYAPQHIRFNTVAPSLTDTPLAQSAGLVSPNRLEAAGKRHPLGRIGTSADIAGMVTFLLSEESGWVTGQILGVDGGMSTLK